MRNGNLFVWYTACISCMGLLLSWPRFCLADQLDLLTLVREGHRSARQSIHSFSATVTDRITFSDQVGMTITAKYWRSFDIVRIREKQGGGTDDILLRDGEIRQVGRGVEPQRKKVHYVASRRAAVETLAQCDVWRLMLIDFAGPNGGRYDFDHFLEFAQRPPQTSRVKEDGHDCVRLTLSAVSSTGLVQDATLWHDVNRNYLVWKMRVTDEKPSDRSETEILEFSEPAPGVFVPTKCRREAYRHGEFRSREEITLSDIEVNQSITANTLQLPAIPAGTMLDDKIRGVRYPVNEKWEAIGPASLLLRYSVPDESEGVRSGYQSQSASEAKPLSRLLIPASLLVLAIACACLIYRHCRLRHGLRRMN